VARGVQDLPDGGRRDGDAVDSRGEMGWIATFLIGAVSVDCIASFFGKCLVLHDKHLFQQC
jgi:hypothetical protein